ncbi:4-(cytidine 5'-diphospho)-2-C-methyl-D-erythritol kinase [Sphingobacterium bovistauri]|uniref:4-diphosphocytidyl-2-C-methyl-D-erythritol kinase n=1 Tax=Sphingobacterium bovistauri TaxID=2781959 RepID=A0ABS7Z9W3_9SPHI|nr:4-(cytidine 5'-diphospho)-2-C-methyl-D-erythritol kinase [Sphingobacterium bovistauri]MCA5006377.1 4-(cytidine 5'-diphospho)-2-C-methyl-D-erythritol kinase [Sphingobacterium bovistauri]
MISFANAKINLGLSITEKRPDGYHNIETIFYPVQLYDVLEYNEAPEFSFEAYGIDIPDGGDNLCTKAYDLLKKDFPNIPTLSIKLLKNIPVGAGLGGGSSDAAFVLKGLNVLRKLNLTSEQLKSYANRLGADCAFFIENKPLFAEGIGTKFSEVKVDLSQYFIVIVKPEIHISTAEAYSNITPQIPKVDLKRAIQLPIQEWKYYISNDFEIGIFDKHPIIQQVKNLLYEKGALYASMSGSGSAVYGIFEEKINLDDLSHLGKIYYPTEI